MRAIDLESRVITAVDRIRAGQLVEHDLIECKRSWPQENKARQLAGSLNRAGGDPVVYIIGIDEKTGEVHDVSDTDVLDWWGQMTPRFDQIPPEMVRHISVPVGSNGEHVVAVAFASDRAPYVVKTGNANPSLEVPMREGTGTRSARRDELLRILIPTTRLPEVMTLEGSLYAEYAPKVGKPAAGGERSYSQEEGLWCRGSVRIYFAHDGRATATLPAHGMRGTLTINGDVFNVGVQPDASSPEKQPSPTAAPVTTRDGITVTTSGAARLALSLKGFPPSGRRRLRMSKTLLLNVELDVLGETKPIKVSATMQKDKGQELKTEYQEILGNWSYQHAGLS